MNAETEMNPVQRPRLHDLMKSLRGNTVRFPDDFSTNNFAQINDRVTRQT